MIRVIALVTLLAWGCARTTTVEEIQDGVYAINAVSTSVTKAVERMNQLGDRVCSEGFSLTNVQVWERHGCHSEAYAVARCR